VNNATLFSHVAKGQEHKLIASERNRELDAAKAYQDTRLGRQGGPAPGDDVAASLTAIVKNTTGAELEAGAILLANGIVGDLINNQYQYIDRPVFVGVAPTDPTNQIMILRRPLADQDFGEVILSGIAVCQIQINNTADLWAAAIDGDSTKLNSGSAGPARILFNQGGATGLQTCVVSLGDGQAAGGYSDVIIEVLDQSPSTTNGYYYSQIIYQPPSGSPSTPTYCWYRPAYVGSIDDFFTDNCILIAESVTDSTSGEGTQTLPVYAGAGAAYCDQDNSGIIKATGNQILGGSAKLAYEFGTDLISIYNIGDDLRSVGAPDANIFTDSGVLKFALNGWVDAFHFDGNTGLFDLPLGNGYAVNGTPGIGASLLLLDADGVTVHNLFFTGGILTNST
jgi:hypothetical protein